MTTKSTKKSNAKLIDKWIADQNGKPITEQDLKFCIAEFSNNRKNYTKTGLLNLGNANLSGQSFTMDLAMFDITAVNFKETILNKVNFLHAISLAKQSKSLIQFVKVKDQNLENINFTGMPFQNISFTGSSFNRTSLLSILNGVRERGCSITGTILKNIDLSGKCMIDEAIGIYAFVFLDLSRIDFSGCDLSGADLSGTNLNDCNFINANLTGAKIIASYAMNVNFSGANFTNAILSHSNFKDSNFNNAIFHNTEV